MGILQEWSKFNHNVRIALLYTAINSLGMGIWGYAVLSGYLKVLTGSNVYVGAAEGFQGLCQMLVAFPVGHMTDKLGRERILRVACVVGLASSLLLFLSLILGGSGMQEYGLVTAALGGLGFYTGFSNVPLEALFADSTTHVNRARMNQYKFATRILASAAGPLTSIFLFFIVGNTWTLNELKTVFCCGLAVSSPPILLLLLFRDNQALGVESDIAHAHAYSELGEENTEESERMASNDYHELGDGLNPSHGRRSASSASEDDGEIGEDVAVKTHSPSALYWVPRLFAVSDVILGVASGMTIKFFPLFFKEESQLSPIEVNVIFLIAPSCVALQSYFTRLLASRIGRVKAMLMVYVPGVLLLVLMYCMSIGYDVKSGSVPLWQNKWVIVPVYVVRTALMNSTSPVKRAVFMEHVPIEMRGRWSAFESLTRFGWSGSAFIGGLCVDRYGYGATFLVTACLQASALIPISIVGFFVKD